MSSISLPISALVALLRFVEQVQVTPWANLIKTPILLDFNWMRLITIPALEGALGRVVL